MEKLNKKISHKGLVEWVNSHRLDLNKKNEQVACIHQDIENLENDQQELSKQVNQIDEMQNAHTSTIRRLDQTLMEVEENHAQNIRSIAARALAVDLEAFKDFQEIKNKDLEEKIITLTEAQELNKKLLERYNVKLNNIRNDFSLQVSEIKTSRNIIYALASIIILAMGISVFVNI